MASGGEKRGDLYGALGLNKDCSQIQLRNAYKKLAMKWHPDRCSSSGNAVESKEKFQAIQEAYSVLSDSNKRFLYDSGVYDSDDDDNGFGDFIGEMTQMMNQTNPNENGGNETFEELQQLFVDMFQDDLDNGFAGINSSYDSNGCDRFAASSGPSYGDSNKRGNSMMNSGNELVNDFHTVSGAFCFGSSDVAQSSGNRGESDNSKRRGGRKQKISSKHDVSSQDARIST